jgi:hypothetical protein
MQSRRVGCSINFEVVEKVKIPPQRGNQPRTYSSFHSVHVMSMRWDYVSELLPPSEISFIPQVIYGMKSHGEMILTREKRKTRRRICFTATLSTTDPTWTDYRLRSRAYAVRGRWLTAWWYDLVNLLYWLPQIMYRKMLQITLGPKLYTVYVELSSNLLAECAVETQHRNNHVLQCKNEIRSS